MSRVSTRSIEGQGSSKPRNSWGGNAAGALSWTTATLVAAIHLFAVAAIVLPAVPAARAASPETSAAAAVSKLSPDLVAALRHLPVSGRADEAARSSSAPDSDGGGTQLRVLVRYARTQETGEATLAGRAARRRVMLATRDLAVRVGGRVENTFARLGVSVLTVTPAQLTALAGDARVESISANRPVAASGSTPAAGAALDVNPQSVGANLVWNGAGNGDGFGRAGSIGPDGRGVGVAVLDSGIAPSRDFSGRIVAFKDYVNNRTAPYDDFGHGTHVAGIVGGSGAASSGAAALRTFKGIAPGVNLIGVKVLDASGGGDVATVLAGIEWCIANKAAYNIRVINLSLGHPVAESYTTDPLCQAVERATGAGIVVVCSSGNRGDGYGGVGSPGNDPAAITVGASNSRQTVGRDDDVIASYSSRGPTRFDLGIKPDLLAPGNKIVSLRAPGATLDTRFPETRVAPAAYLQASAAASAQSNYATFSGTSMATPAVAGAAALALQINPALQPNGVKAALMYSAQILRGPDPVLGGQVVTYDPLTQGAGELNVAGLCEMASLLQPGAGLAAQPSLATTIGGQTFGWTGPAVAADNLAWGGRLWGNNFDWGGQSLWGDNLAWGGRMLWGDNLAWGGRLVAADNLSWGGRLAWADNLAWGGRLLEANQLVWNGNLLWGDNLAWGGRIAGDNLAWGGH